MAAAGAVLLASGCTKGGWNGGRQIQFGVTSGSAATKAVYGADNASHSTQAIDWETGDGIVIASPQATVTSNEGVHVARYQVATVTQTGTSTDVVSKGQLELADANGFEWPDEDPAGGYTFYAAYPSTLGLGTDGTVTASIATPTLGTAVDKTVYLDADGKVSYTETATSYTYKAYPADKSQFVLTAHTHVAASGSGVTLGFDPAFTAIEFNVTSADDDFTLTKAELIASGSDYLTGQFTMTAGSLATAAVAADSKKTENQTVAVTLDNAITQTQGVTFTLFTLPVTNQSAYQLRLTTGDGQTATLTLNKAGEAYPFQAGEKYRINLLKLGGQWKYKIELAPDALPWDLIGEGEEIETTFTEQVAADKFVIKYSKQSNINTRDGYTAIDWSNSGSWYDDNDYQDADGNPDPSSQSRYYQVRTLDPGYGKEFFEVTFRPRAPMGGYWFLTVVPVGKDADGNLDTVDMFDVVVWDEEEEWDPAYKGSPDLSGQIMSQPVTLHVSLKESLRNDPSFRSSQHALIIKATFSPTPNSDAGTSADSEIQDAHKDGTFSWWKFVFDIQ